MTPDEEICEPMTQRWFSWRYCLSMIAGEALGLEQYSKRLLQMAGERFAQGKDNEARLLREIAQNCADCAQDARQHQEEHNAQEPARMPKLTKT